MKFKCNIETCTSQVQEFSAVNSYNSAQTSGMVDIQLDIDNGLLGKKHYYCPSCFSKLLWDKMAEITGTEGVDGTFTMVDDDGSTPVEVPGQEGLEDGNTGGQEDVIPELVQPRVKYVSTEWKSAAETTEQKELISWEINGVTYYGTKAMNNIEQGIVEAQKRLNHREQQTLNMAKFIKSLRTGKETSIAMFADSVMWGYCSVESEDRISCVDYPTVDDYGKKFNYNGYFQNVIRIPETMIDTLNSVYDNKLTLIKKIWTGDTAQGAPSHWKASKADVAIMNYGINDAMGGHISIDYRGHIDLFIKTYKELIERELLNGTAVMLLTPFKQATIGREGVHGDNDDRTLIDVYEQAVYDIAAEYGIPVIDGNEMIRNLTNDAFIDFTHFTGEMNASVGKKLASIFIGQSPKRPLAVKNNSYLGVRHQLDNVKLVGGTCFEYKEESPNQATGIATPDLDSPNVTRNPGGIQATLKADADKIVWSFYCEQDGMICIPSYSTTSDAEVTVKLDFGGVQGTWPNYYNVMGKVAVDRTHKEDTIINYASTDLVDGHYGYHAIADETQKVMKIVSAGHHTIEISVNGLQAGEEVNVYGLTFLDMQNYLLEMNLNA